MCCVLSAGISGKGPAGGESGEALAGTGGAFAKIGRAHVLNSSHV